MRISILYLFRKLASRSWDPQVRKHTYILLICLGISIFIWLMIKMSKDYYSSVNCEIAYTNIPDDKLLSSEADSTISVELYAQGFQLFNIKYLSDKPKIKIDLKNGKIQKTRYKFGSYVLSSDLIGVIEDELDIDNNIVDIRPDTISFVLEDLVSKVLPVKADVNISFKKQYQLNDEIEINPDSITVAGAPSVVDTMKFVHTQKMDLPELTETKRIHLPLKKPGKAIVVKYSIDTVEVVIPVEKFTEASVEIPVEIVPDGQRVKLFPGKVEVKYIVALSDYNKVSPDMFKASADFTNVSPSSKTVKVSVVHSPQFVRVVRTIPERAEFIYLR